MSETVNVFALKQKIIEAGISGKLVPQMASDGTAEELLKQIEAERATLIKAGKIKKEKPLPEITEDEIPFEIPKSWKWMRLGAISNFGMNISVSPNKIGENEWILELEDIEKETGNVLNRKRKSEVNPKSTKHKFKTGNVLYSKMRPYLNKVLVADTNGYCTSEIHILDFGAHILSIYAKICLQSPYFLAYANSHSYGDKPRLNTIDGKLALFPLPPLSEQKRIVAKIEELMAEIDNLERNQSAYTANQDSLKKKIIEAGISGKLVPQIAAEGTADELLKQIIAERAALIKAGKIKKEKPLPEITEDGIPFEIPKSWKWVRLGKLISIKSGDALTQNNFKKGNIPVYGGNGIVGYHDISNTNNPSIIIGRVGFYCGSIHQTKGKAWITDNAFITTIPNKSVDINYLTYGLRWINLGEKSRSTAQPVISGNTVYPCYFPLPPLAEQKRIVSKIEELMDIIERTDR